MPRSTLSFPAFAISLALSGSAATQELSSTLPANEIDRLPDQVRFLIYDRQDASLPIEVADFDPEQYRLEMKNGQVTISAELLREIDSQTLWIETELDGIPMGERVPTAIAIPGVTFATGNHLNMGGNAITDMEMPDAPGQGTDVANRAYVDAAGDNLGNHTATANLNMGDYEIRFNSLEPHYKVYKAGIVTHLGQFKNLMTEKFELPQADSSALPSCTNSSHPDEGHIYYSPDNGNVYICTCDKDDLFGCGDYGWRKL